MNFYHVVEKFAKMKKYQSLQTNFIEIKAVLAICKNNINVKLTIVIEH